MFQATWHLGALGEEDSSPGAGGAREKWAARGVPLRPGSVGAPGLSHPTAPGQGGGAVSLRAFWLLGADGQAGRGPLSFVWLCTKEGASWGGGRLQQVGGWGLAPPPPNPARMPLGEVCSLGMYLLSGHRGPHRHPQIPRIPFPCGVPPPRQKPHHTRVRRLPASSATPRHKPSLPAPTSRVESSLALSSRLQGEVRTQLPPYGGQGAKDGRMLVTGGTWGSLGGGRPE